METPSRILRRIEALEAQDSDLPSLPSFPEFEGSEVKSFQASSAHSVSPKTIDSGPSDAADDFATPYNRRRSFLLSFVHSTTRPRMTFPTPHPHTRAAPTPRLLI